MKQIRPSTPTRQRRFLRSATFKPMKTWKCILFYDEVRRDIVNHCFDQSTKTAGYTTIEYDFALGSACALKFKM